MSYCHFVTLQEFGENTHVVIDFTNYHLFGHVYQAALKAAPLTVRNAPDFLNTSGVE